MDTLYRFGNFSGTQATGASVNMAWRAINDRFYTFYVRLPGTVGTSVRVRNLNTKGNTFSADIAFCHFLHLLMMAGTGKPFPCIFCKEQYYISITAEEKQVFFTKPRIFLDFTQNTGPFACICYGIPI